MQQIKFRYGYTDGKTWMFKVFTIDEIEMREADRILDIPMYENYKLTTRDIAWNVSGHELYTNDLFKAYCSISGKKDKKVRICKVCHSGDGMSVSVWHEGEWWGYSYMDYTSMELIGNIHENPLLP